MELRTLELSPEVPGFEYWSRACTKKFLGICTKWEMVKETYDLRDEATRTKLIQMGFIGKVRDIPIPR